MTRNWPMESTPDEEHDHPHHRSFWYAHGLVNGRDFWDQGTNSGKIIHDGFIEIKSGKKSGTIKTRNNWTNPDGSVLCKDEETLLIFNTGKDNQRMFDFEITLHASDKGLVFGDTKEGTMAVRLAETMRLTGKVGHGHIINSEGVRDGDTWGKRADWCDYYGPVEEKIVGMAIFDHPENPRHPTWWHVRDYGLFAANPFGRHNFENLPDKTAGNLSVAPGKDITFRYRFYLHTGDEKEGQVAEKYQEYIKAKAGK